MSDLLDKAIEAHGGWGRWQEIEGITADMSAVGLWHLKGWPDVLKAVKVEVDPHRQHAAYSPFLKAGQIGLFEGNRTAIVTGDGAVVEEQQDTAQSFGGHSLMTPWNVQQLIYFTGYAIWTYLTTPFLLRTPGFRLEEGEPWEESGEVWRRLKVEFPENIRSHSRQQSFYFDDRGLLRRHDYSVDIIGGSASANYTTEHKTFGGIVFPTQRCVYRTTPDNHPILDRAVVAIDIHKIDLT
ncbi:hypothetical protein [Cupriavidus numazuensis]|uniref:Uncharacterized protein n=1 Tax=Cupriavidus numazuensis TaxID=221992 RepID=A0ABM8TWG7_9BURK|nr:hypothetical protein [Cupriavidus numazuensis]CAG2161149.1 hypothetical protein LMG26411_08034 [Cupriavidus numazuensis]